MCGSRLAYADGDSGAEPDETYGELPKNTLVVRPGQMPVNLPSPRWMFDDLQVDGISACVSTTDRLEAELKKSRTTVRRLAERHAEPAWRRALRWSSVGLSTGAAVWAGSSGRWEAVVTSAVFGALGALL